MRKFVLIDKAASLAGTTVRELLHRAIDGELPIYAKGDWFWCELEDLDKRYNVRAPIYLNDLDQIAMLAITDHFQLFVDSDSRLISKRKGHYCDGVTVSEKNLFCLKSDIESMRDTANSSDDKSKGRRKLQIKSICETALGLGYSDLQNIPEGGKSKIANKCLENKKLFTMDSFKKAWIEAGKQNLIRLTCKEKYLSNQYSDGVH